LLALALLAIAAAVPADATPGLVASSLYGTGTVTTNGTLGALAFYDTTQRTAASPFPLPSSDFTLTAARVEARTYSQDYVHSIGTGGVPLKPQSGPQVQWQNFTQATLHGTAVREGYWVYVLPLTGHPAPEWAETSGCAQGRLTSSPSLVVDFNVGAPSTQANVGGSLTWAVPCPSPPVRHVRGSFLVSLWQWDASVESVSRNGNLQSGKEPMASGPKDLDLSVSHDRQVLLEVLEGDFRLPTFFADWSQTYLFAPRIHTVGDVVLQNPEGFLAAQQKKVHESTLFLTGDFVLTTARSFTTGIPMTVEGVVASSPTAIGVPHINFLAWLWLLSLPALAAVPMWLVWRRQGLVPQSATPQGRARAMDLFGHAETFAFEGGFRKARRLLDKAIRLDGLRPDLFALRARCLAMLGDTDAALRDHLHAHEAFPAGDPDAKASNAYEAARTCNQAGRRDEALSWLHLAAQYDPYILDDARDDPVLLSLFTSISGRPRRAER
jgi:hypothetical protein